MRKAGDILQIVNPIAGLALTTLYESPVNYALSYGISMGLVGLGKYNGRQLEYPGAARPRDGTYNGMPSGHTASAWLPAAYAAKSNDQRLVRASYILYPVAAFTGVSRVTSKRHYWYQVAAAIVICETITYINRKHPVAVGITPNGIYLSYKF